MTVQLLNKLSKIKLIISDWSGVFSDDRLPVYESNMRVIEKHGKQRVSFKEWLPITRMTPVELFNDFGINGNSDSLFEEYRLVLNKVRSEGIHPIMYKDVKRTLQILHDRKIPIVIVSSHPEENLKKEAIEYEVHKYISQFYGNVKDKAKGIIDVCANYNLLPEFSIYLGDTIYDILAAKKAGVKSVAVSTGYHLKERLLKESPDLVLDSLYSLLLYLK